MKKNNRMLVVGLTGGIGVGKTTVSEIFKTFNVPIIDTDLIARQLTEPTSAVFPIIHEHFPSCFDHGKLNRASLRRLIFSNSDHKLWLEKLLHPLIEEAVKVELSKLSAPYVIVVIPLLFEGNHYLFLDRVLVVDASEAQQVMRVMVRDQVPAEEVSAIASTQSSRHEKLTWADDIVDNNGSLQDLQVKVEKLHQLYLSLASQNK